MVSDFSGFTSTTVPVNRFVARHRTVIGGREVLVEVEGEGDGLTVGQVVDGLASLLAPIE